MATQSILVPYNFMPYDQKVLDFVTRNFVRQEDVEITLFKSYTPLPDIESHKSPVMAKLKSNLSFMTTKIKEQEEGLQNVKQDLLKSGFSDNQVQVVFKPKKKKDVGSEIIALAMQHSFDVIVLNHKPGKIANFFTGNVFNKVITTLENVAVCVVT